MESKDDDQFNPWDVGDLDIYLTYCCPECYSHHQTKDVFVQHALLEHPKASKVLKNPVEKDGEVKSDNPQEALPVPSNKVDFVEPEFISKPRTEEKCSLKRKSVVIDSDVQSEEHRKKCKNDQSEDPEDTKPMKSCKQSQTCEICGKVCSCLKNLRKHLQLQHGDVPEEKCIRTCSQCKVEFKSSKIMDEHYKNQCQDKNTKKDSKFKCNFCDDEWISHLSLELHILEIHKKEMYSCTECKYITFWSKKRIDHMNRVHKNVRDHVCHHCGQDFIRKNTLEKHLFKEHNEGDEPIRKYPCDQCDKSFYDKRKLRRHIATNHDKSVSY